MGAKEVEALWDFNELKAFLNMPASTIRLHIATGKIPSVRLGRHRRFIPDEVIKALRRMPQ